MANITTNFDSIILNLSKEDYAIDVGRKICHGSDSVENAKEIALWFKEGKVQTYRSAQHN